MLQQPLKVPNLNGKYLTTARWDEQSKLPFGCGKSFPNSIDQQYGKQPSKLRCFESKESQLVIDELMIRPKNEVSLDSLGEILDLSFVEEQIAERTQKVVDSIDIEQFENDLIEVKDMIDDIHIWIRNPEAYSQVRKELFASNKKLLELKKECKAISDKLKDQKTIVNKRTVHEEEKTILKNLENEHQESMMSEAIYFAQHETGAQYGKRQSKLLFNQKY